MVYILFEVPCVSQKLFAITFNLFKKFGWSDIERKRLMTNQVYDRHIHTHKIETIINANIFIRHIFYWFIWFLPFCQPLPLPHTQTVAYSSGLVLVLFPLCHLSYKEFIDFECFVHNMVMLCCTTVTTEWMRQIRTINVVKIFQTKRLTILFPWSIVCLCSCTAYSNYWCKKIDAKWRQTEKKYIRIPVFHNLFNGRNFRWYKLRHYKAISLRSLVSMWSGRFCSCSHSKFLCTVFFNISSCCFKICKYTISFHHYGARNFLILDNY